MNAEMARIGLEVELVLKGIFALLALFGVVKAIRKYNAMQTTQKFNFWFAVATTITALLWVATMSLLLAYPHLAKMIPEAGWYIIIFASPTAALAAGATMGLYNTSNTSSVQ